MVVFWAMMPRMACRFLVVGLNEMLTIVPAGRLA